VVLVKQSLFKIREQDVVKSRLCMDLQMFQITIRQICASLRLAFQV
jgi:hypothetical protein